MAEETAAPQEEAPATETRSEDRRSRSRASLVAVLERLGRWTAALLARPRVRTVFVGAALIIIGAFFVQHSLWTFPIVIVGILMVVVAWVGGRLEGRFAVEWSEAGTGFEMRARFKSATPLLTAPPLSAPPLSAPPRTVSTTTVTTTRPATETEIQDAETIEDETIEGEAHTVEIDVDELRALIQAAEQLARESATTTDVPVSWQENRAA